MGDFPPQWKWVRDLAEGGQAHTFVVRHSDGKDPREFVLKRLKNPKREDYFRREIRACMALDHPNVLKVLEDGATPSGKPYLITKYCAGGSLADGVLFDAPASGLRFFEQIVAGVAHALGQQRPIYHLDLKPENILLQDKIPIVGDWGICFIEEDQITVSKEGPRGSIYYCAPELRGPKIAGNPTLPAADVYSLGKILYFLFTRDVYDGHEQDYGSDSERSLMRIFPANPQFAFVDEVISKTVRWKPSDRIASAAELLQVVRRVAERVEAGGRVLNIAIPQRCLYCAEGHYQPAHDRYYTAGGYLPGPRFPEIQERRKEDDQSYPERSRYAAMRSAAGTLLGVNRVGIPLLLICDFCGNVQYFRLEATADGRGENWRP